MAFLRARAFIACLPLRSGIWILGLVGLIVSGFGAAGSAMLLTLLKEHPVTLIPKISLFVQTGAMGLFGLISIFGILAAIMQSHGVAFIYKKVILADLLVNLPALGYIVFATLRPSSEEDVAACLNGHTDRTEMIFQFCEPGVSVVKGFSWALMASIILVQFYSLIIASSWSDQLFQDSAAYVDRSLDFSDTEKGNVVDPTKSRFSLNTTYKHPLAMPRFQDPFGRTYG